MRERPIEIALKGIQDIMKSDFIISLLKQYPIDDNALGRMRSHDFRDWIHCVPFFHLKECDELYTPANTLSSLILSCPDKEIVKLFFILYCCSSAASLFKSKIVRYFHPSWDVENTHRLHRLDVRSFSPEDYEDLKSGRILERIGVYNIDEIISKIQPEGTYGYSRVRQGVLQMCLTAGYHYVTDIDLMPNDLELYQLRETLPVVLAGSQYVSTITGTDFFEAMREVINQLKFAWPFDRLINVCANNYETEKLKIEKTRLQSQINAIEEKVRKADTADEIMMQSFDWPVPDGEIMERIKKCNASQSRELLYKLESKLGGRFSFLDLLNKIASKAEILSFISDNKVVFSDDELSCTITVENLVDTIIEHKKFLDSFVECLFYDKIIHWSAVAIHDCYDPKYYKLETKLKEVENMFSTQLNVKHLSSEEDIRTAVLHKYPAIREFVSVIRDALQVTADRITLDADIFDDLCADSLSIFDLEDVLEDNFGFKLSSVDFESKVTIKDIITGIICRIREQNESD